MPDMRKGDTRPGRQLRSAIVVFCTLTLACISSGLAFVRTTEARRAGEENIMLRRDMEMLIQGLRERTLRDWTEPFLVGTLSRDDDSWDVEWDQPPDGLFVVVSRDCPWCFPFLRDLQAYAPSDGTPLYLLTFAPESIRAVIESGEPDRAALYSIIRPVAGWWASGLPSEVTPFWFRFSEGQLEGLGPGVPETTSAAPQPQATIAKPYTGPNTQAGTSDPVASRIARK